MGCDADRGWEANHGAPAAETRAPGGVALTAAPVLQSLLGGAIDYAGLFPPAALSMADAVDEYTRHRLAPDRWALGRFVVPLSRWAEFEAPLRGKAIRGSEAWAVSVLAAASDADTIRGLAEQQGAAFRIEAIECRAASIRDVVNAAGLVSLGVDVFVEASLPPRDLPGYAEALCRIGAAGKIRTGGLTSDAIPDARYVLAFMRACRSAPVRFKATAGLHHAIRGDYPLTYEPDGARGLLFGFLNVVIAAAFVWADHEDDIVLGVLEERTAAAFSFTDSGVTWRDQHLSQQDLEAARSAFFVGFGSCSFREPMVELGLEPAAAS